MRGVSCVETSARGDRPNSPCHAGRYGHLWPHLLRGFRHNYFGNAVGESNVDIQALIAAAGAFNGPGIIVPARNSDLFRWCLQNGLRVVHPMTLMTMGLYNEPVGAYLPSILY